MSLVKIALPRRVTSLINFFFFSCMSRTWPKMVNGIHEVAEDRLYLCLHGVFSNELIDMNCFFLANPNKACF
jgi:hypothetical protein